MDKLLIGKRIKQKRLEQKLSCRILGLAVGVTPQAIQRYEQGNVDIPMTRLAALAHALHISVTELITEESPTHVP